MAQSTENDPLESGALVENSTAPNIADGSTSSDEEELPETDQNESRWTTVSQCEAQMCAKSQLAE